MAFNPLLAESELVHRVTVDRLKWQLGAPVPWPLLEPDWPLYHPSYCYYGYYGYPWAGAPSYQYDHHHYSRGFRDGLSASQRSSGASTPGGGGGVRGESPTAAASAPAAKAGKAGEFPGDLMGFPSGSYRRPLCAYPVSTGTSYDDLTQAWPYGCKPFYFRRADPPSVQFC